MKKHLLLLGLISCLALSGCTLLDKYMSGYTPSEQDEEKPKDPIPSEDETPGEDTSSEEDKPTLVSIEIVGELKKTEYFVGENWDTDGLSIAGTYSDGNVSPLLENEYEFGFKPYTPLAGTTEVTISARQNHGDLIADSKYYAVTVSEKPIQSIKIEGDFVQKTYIEDNPWNPEGLTVKAIIDEDNEFELTKDKYALAYNPEKATIDTTSVEVIAMLNEPQLDSPIKTINDIIVTPKLIEYTISFDGNGATSGSMDSTKTTETSYQAPACEFEKEGYSFEKWALNSVDGEKYSVGDTISVSSNIILYAIWKENPKPTQYTISFEGNGATSGSMSSVFITETSYSAPVCGYQKDGYSFDKWALNSVDGEKYDVGDNIKISSNITLYATWKINPSPIKYTISFNGNGATSGSMNPVEITTNSYITPSCSFERTDYTFDKWALNSPSGAKYSVGVSIPVSSDITLYATWIADSPSGDDYYAEITDDLKGQDLIDALNALNNKHKKSLVGYDGLKSYFKLTERTSDTPSNKMVGFYDNALVNADWDNQATWNREHVWPNSHGGGKKGDVSSPYVDADIHMTRPTSVNINSERGNDFYGKSIYDPGQYVNEYRGIAARIIFYCAIADTRLLVIDANTGGGHHMGKLSDLLEWNLAYLPTTSSTASTAYRVEQNRNEVIYSHPNLQGNRNPFIDHPEYACRIWGGTNSTTRQICGM